VSPNRGRQAAQSTFSAYPVAKLLSCMGLDSKETSYPVNRLAVNELLKCSARDSPRTTRSIRKDTVEHALKCCSAECDSSQRFLQDSSKLDPW
jgi:hypothetical protein